MIALPRPIYMLSNIGLYHLGWLACVLAAAAGRPLWGVAGVVGLLGLHLLIAPQPLRDLRLVAAFGAVGLVVDSTNALLGVFTFAAPVVPAWLCPPWLAAIWALFAIVPHGFLGWLLDRYRLAALLGAVAGPMAYWGGAQMGAITLHLERPHALPLLALSWAAAVPLLLWLARRLDTAPAAPNNP